MIGRSIDIPAAQGVIDAYAAHPEAGHAYPLIILFMDVWGLREELFAIARRVGAEGYYCVVPNLFHREGRFRFAPRNAEGRTVSFNTLPEDLQQDMRARAERLNRETLRQDVTHILEFCRGEPVSSGAAGSVGFCMGGREAFFAAQEFPQRFRATASLHGSRLVTEAADSPHQFAHEMRGEVYCGFAEHDRGASPAIVSRLDQALQGVTDLQFKPQMHLGAHHGYALPDRDVYDHAAAELDWTHIFAMLRRQLA